MAEDDLARIARLQAVDLEGRVGERLDEGAGRHESIASCPGDRLAVEIDHPALARQAAGQFEIHREIPGVGGDVDKLVGVVKVERDGRCLTIAGPADPLAPVLLAEAGPGIGRLLPAHVGVDEPLAGRDGHLERWVDRAAMSRAGIPVVRVSRQLDVLDVPGPDGPAGCPVDQAPGDDHAAGDLEGRLDRLEPLGIADGEWRGVEVLLDA